MAVVDPEMEFSKGMEALNSGDSLAALVHFEKAVQAGGGPLATSYYAYCIARERGQVQKGIALCHEAMAQEPDNARHYLNLGRIYLTARNKTEALRVFREGMGVGHDQEIAALLEEIGSRKPPVIASLHRDHLINKYLGMILSKLGLR